LRVMCCHISYRNSAVRKILQNLSNHNFSFFTAIFFNSKYFFNYIKK
jgi:hypothetical protein